MVKTTMDKDNIMLVILKFCFLLRENLNKKHFMDAHTITATNKNTPSQFMYFMDSPTVTAAINNNNPAELTKLIKSFIKVALNQIENFGPIFESIKLPKIKSSLKNSIFMMNDRVNNDFDNRNARQLIMIQLAVWSVVSSETFKSITSLLLNFWNKKIDVNKFDKNKVWLWLYNLISCILATTSCVYKINATDFQSKNPVCQLLLLEASIHHNSLPFKQFGIGIGSLDLNEDVKATTDTKMNSQNNQLQHQHWTKKFVEYLKGIDSAKSDNNKTLRCFWEWGNPEIPTNEITYAMDGFMKVASCEKEKKQSISPEFLIQPPELPKLKPKESPVVVSTPFTLPAKMSMDTHKVLRKNLELLMKKMEEHKIHSCLKKNWKLKLQDINKFEAEFPTMKASYLKCCEKFAETEFPKDNSNVLKYMKTMCVFSGLLIYDYLQTTDSNDMMLDYKNVLAHVLKHCIAGSISKRGFSWHTFFNMLIPQSAFNDDCAQHLMILAIYSKNCIHVMSIEVPSKLEKQFQFYFQSNYFFDMDLMIEKTLIEVKTKKGGQKRVSEESESFHTPRISNKQKKLTTEKQVTTKDPSNCSKKELANIQGTSMDSRNPKRKELPKRQEVKKTIDSPEFNNKKTPVFDCVKSPKLETLTSPSRASKRLSEQRASPSKKNTN